MNLIEIFSILIIHWIADFILQTHWQAINKSKNNCALLEHTLIYTLFWSFIGVIYICFNKNTYHEWDLPKFLLITFICHTITDYFTSRLNTWLWIKKDVHNFFVSVGFDQLLHYIQLFVTYWLLIK